MLMKKKMKTKFDYQARTFGACVVLLMSFTLMFITPSLDKVAEENTTILPPSITLSREVLMALSLPAVKNTTSYFLLNS